MKIGQHRERRLKYEQLLSERDRLYRECDSIMTSYNKEFGDLITANYKLKIECIKMKKTISYCRRRVNRGLAIDTDRMKAEIEQEMKRYYTQLKEVVEDPKTGGKTGVIREAWDGCIDFDDIETRTEQIERQIREIQTSEPYIYREMLENEDKKQAYRDRLQAEHDDQEHYLENLAKQLDDILREENEKYVNHSQSA